MDDGRTQRVTIPYLPRPQFTPFHGRRERWAVMVAHRRAGKTVACINDLIRGVFTTPKERPRFGYIAPLRSQAKATAWDYAKHYSRPIPGVTNNEAELRIDYPNEGRLQLFGADNPDALRGIYLDGAVLDEYAQMRPQVWPEVIRPALADRGGWAVFIGTPMGRNAFCKIYEDAKASPDWFAAMLKASETGLLPQAELDDAQRSMSPDQYAQEFECSFEAAIVGAYYGALMAAAEKEKRLTRVPHDPAALVYTAWDLGVGDSTAIWFVQQVGHEVHVIDYLEASGMQLGWYVGEIHERRQRGWNFAEHIWPHDGGARELGSGDGPAVTREETARSLGLTVRILQRQNVDDGINAARMMLPRCWFDADRCARGIEAMRQYRREWDDKRQAFNPKPLHDWTSHAADAFRYLAQGLRKQAGGMAPIKYRDDRSIV